MMFIIKRTSIWEEKPCKEAVKITTPYWHIRTCSEEDFDKRFSSHEGLWRSKGKNHTVTKDGCITRQEEDRENWGVEVESLEDVIKMIGRYGSLIIQQCDECGEVAPIYEIEIYDDYRE